MELSDFIASLALITSVIALTYTILVDRRRPRLEVAGGIKWVFEGVPPNRRQTGTYFAIDATNLGPGRIYVLGVGLTHRSRFRRWYRRAIQKERTIGVLMDTAPESPQKLPIWLEVGERVMLFYPEDTEVLEENELFDCFYLYDSLGGKHWAPKGVFKEARGTSRS